MLQHKHPKDHLGVNAPFFFGGNPGSKMGPLPVINGVFKTPINDRYMALQMGNWGEINTFLCGVIFQCTMGRAPTPSCSCN